MSSTLCALFVPKLWNTNRHIISIAGRDTTAQCLTWLFYNLAKHPRVEQKLLVEIKENFTPSTPIDFETVKNLKYLKACIDETLRYVLVTCSSFARLISSCASLYPSVPLDLKMSVKDDVLPSGFRIPAGTAVNWAAWPMGRHKNLWDEPLLYFPERWCVSDFGPCPALAHVARLGDTSLGSKPVPQGQCPPFIPFQFGPRLCLGMNMVRHSINPSNIVPPSWGNFGELLIAPPTGLPRDQGDGCDDSPKVPLGERRISSPHSPACCDTCRA